MYCTSDYPYLSINSMLASENAKSNCLRSFLSISLVGFKPMLNALHLVSPCVYLDLNGFLGFSYEFFFCLEKNNTIKIQWKPLYWMMYTTVSWLTDKKIGKTTQHRCILKKGSKSTSTHVVYIEIEKVKAFCENEKARTEEKTMNQP